MAQPHLLGIKLKFELLDQILATVINRMRKHFGEVALFVSVFVHTLAKVCIAVIANMLTLHTLVLTRHFSPTFIAPEVTVIIIAVAYLLIAFITIMLGCVLVSAVDDSVATIAIVIFVIVYVIANKFFATFITVSVVIIIVAIGGKPYSAPIACMVIIVVLMPDVIEVLFTRSFLTASVAERISVIVDMMNAF